MPGRDGIDGTALCSAETVQMIQSTIRTDTQNRKSVSLFTKPVPLNRLMLIGCSKSKNDVGYNSMTGGRVVPEQLYCSQLFNKRVDYAELNGLRWAVLSAKYGVWFPTIGLKPYDMTFADLNQAEIAAWHIGCASRLIEELWEPFNEKQADEPMKPGEFTIEIHAGADYCHPLSEILQSVGIKVELPLKGLGIGEQLAWYSQRAK